MNRARINLLYLLLMGAFYGFFCLCVAFTARFLHEHGFSYTQIATATMISSVCGFFIQPLWGTLNDRGVSPKLLVFITTGLSVAGFFLLTYHGGVYIVSVISLIISALGAASMMPIIDAWGVKLISQGEGLSYPVTRSFGSLTYALTSILFGIMLDALGMRVTPWLMLILAVPLAVVTLLLPAPRAARADVGSQKFSEAVGILLRHPTYKYYVIAFFISGIGSAAQLLYYPMLMLELGGTNSHIGTGLAVMALAEVVVMPFYGKLRARFGVRNIYVFSLFGTGVRILVVALSVNPLMGIYMMVLQSIAGALAFPSIPAYVSENIDSRLISTAQVFFLAMGFTLAGVASNLVSGHIAAALGVRNTLLIMCCAPFAAAVYLLIMTGKRRISNDRTA
ncbi:MAG: MFS transporter [Oscillospiraceae bacterium]|nr:MFS transporter [Oscillospiraceae bacterium]